MKNIMIIFILFTLSFLISNCKTPQNEFHLNRPQDLLKWESGKVALLPALFLNQINRKKTSDDRFNNNLYVGKINYSGGYIKKETPLGVITKTKKTVFSSESEYRERSSLEVSTEILKLFQKKKIDFQLIDKINSEVFSPFVKTQDYSKSPDEGKDNINLPRHKYQAPNRIPGALENNVNIKKSGAQYIFVPIIVQYYSHNAGWFNDQEIGCLAGTRIALQFVVYDLRSRTKVMDVLFEQKKLYPFTPSININQTYRDLNEILLAVLRNVDSYILAPK